MKYTVSMSAVLNSDPTTDVESRITHNATPTSLEDLQGLLMRLQTPMNMSPNEFDDKTLRQQLYEQFALVAMLIRNQTTQTRIEFIDLAYFFNPEIHGKIGQYHIFKILGRWKILKSKAKELQNSSSYSGMFMHNLIVLMKKFERHEHNIWQYIPEYYHYEEIDSPMSFVGYISAPMTSENILWIRDTCLILAMTLKDRDEVRVEFLNLAYYFEPIVRNLLTRTYNGNNLDFYIIEEWKVILKLTDQIYNNVNTSHTTKLLFKTLQDEMYRYTPTIPTVLQVQPVRTQQNYGRPQVNYARTPWATR